MKSPRSMIFLRCLGDSQAVWCSSSVCLKKDSSSCFRPFNSSIIDDLTFALNTGIELIVCDPNQVTSLIENIMELMMSYELYDGEGGFEQFDGLDEENEADGWTLPTTLLLSAL